MALLEETLTTNGMKDAIRGVVVNPEANPKAKSIPIRPKASFFLV